jgi:hypothetical protein
MLDHLRAWRDGDHACALKIWDDGLAQLNEYVYSKWGRLHVRYKTATWLRGVIATPWMRAPMPKPRREEVVKLRDLSAVQGWRSSTSSTLTRSSRSSWPSCDAHGGCWPTAPTVVSEGPAWIREQQLAGSVPTSGRAVTASRRGSPKTSTPSSASSSWRCWSRPRPHWRAWAARHFDHPRGGLCRRNICQQLTFRSPQHHTSNHHATGGIRRVIQFDY